MGRSCSVIQSGENSGWAAFFDEIAHNLVVKVLDGGPLDLLANILFLFGLQGKLYEDLLKFLVDVVDT
jgi:hypothetical protein